MADSNIIKTRIKLAYDTDTNWTAKNPELYQGEMILVDPGTGKPKIKVGKTGVKYSALSYLDVDSIEGTVGRKYISTDSITGQKVTGEVFNNYGGNKASNYAHAEGWVTNASGFWSHAEGDHTTASGEASHSEGGGTIASGIHSHAEGHSTNAKGECSHAEGFGTIASKDYQHVQGTYNIEDTGEASFDGENYSIGNYLHIVGNGKSESARSNAHTLDWQGNAWFAGSVNVSKTETNDDFRTSVIKKSILDADKISISAKNESPAGISTTSSIINNYNLKVSSNSDSEIYTATYGYNDIIIIKEQDGAIVYTHKLSNKIDKPTVNNITPTGSTYTYNLLSDNIDNSITLIPSTVLLGNTVKTIEIAASSESEFTTMLKDNPNFCAELRFSTYSIAPQLSFFSLIYFMGTDCYINNGTYIFEPKPNMHYNILFSSGDAKMLAYVTGYSIA